MKLPVANEGAMQDIGVLLAEALPQRCVCFLQGQLGAGKTTLVRAILKAMGYAGTVKSPTYALVEAYEINLRTVLHMDLYRLADPEELEFLGVRDYLSTDAAWFVEWPEKGAGFLPAADLLIVIDYVGHGRSIEILARSPVGERCLSRLQAQNT